MPITCSSDRLWEMATVVMSNRPSDGSGSPPLTSTAVSPSTSPSTSNRGPGPSEAKGTVTAGVDMTAASATIGSAPTIRVRVRRFTVANPTARP